MVAQRFPSGGTNNQEISVGGCAPSYDGRGNLTKDCTFATPAIYVWDTDGDPVSFNGVSLTYDVLDHEVQVGTTAEIIYSPLGKLGIMNGQTASKIRISLPGGSTAELIGSTGGITHILHADWLGSARISSLFHDRSMQYDTAYAPFGESYDTVLNGDPDFTGALQDTLSGLYDFAYRYYNPVQGRWISPDPAGLAAVDPTNPQSWNRYAYAFNNPLRFIDPTGLILCDYGPSDNGGEDFEDADDAKECTSHGGTLANDQTTVTVNGDAPNVPTATFENGEQIFPQIVAANNRFRIWSFLKMLAHSTLCAGASAQLALAHASSGVAGLGGGGAFGIGAWWGISGSGSVSLVADPHGNVGVAFSGSFNPGTAGGGVVGTGAAAGYSVTLSEAGKISDLNGVGTSVSGNVGPVAVSGSFDDPATLTISGGGGELGHVSFTAEYGGTVVPQALTTNCSDVFLH